MRRAIALFAIGTFVLSACGPTVVRPPTPSPTVAPAVTRAPTVTPVVTRAPAQTTGGAATSAATPASGSATTAIVELEKGGSFTIALRPDKAPQTVARFVGKARDGFYNGLKFHRVEDWVVQGGDPLGTGTGGGRVPSEYNDLPFVLGAVGIARGGDKAFNNESQWFVVKKEASWLNNEYTNFGTVTAGMDVVQKIAIGDKIKTVRIP